MGKFSKNYLISIHMGKKFNFEKNRDEKTRPDSSTA
jgi:hypothetical protein